MLSRHSLALLVSGIGIGTAASMILYFYAIQSSPDSPATPRISSSDAIHIAENDIDRWNSVDGKKYGVNYRITDIAVNPPRVLNETLDYIPIEEFRQEGGKLPLVYVSSNNRTVLRIYENGTSENIGQCNTALSTYCGYLPPFKLDYQGRLVYGVHIQGLSKDDLKEPLFFLVDAKNGQIVDSTFARQAIDISPPFYDK
jgi:hypothetical protein